MNIHKSTIHSMCCEKYKIHNGHSIVLFLIVGQVVVKGGLICFWATVCKTIHPTLSDRCLSVCPVLSLCDVGVLWPNRWMD